MRRIKLLLLCILGVALWGCDRTRPDIPTGSDTQVGESSVVEVKKGDGGKWKLIVNGKHYYVNGAATNRFYSDVHRFGGNTIRLYSTKTDDTKAILKEAAENGLMVYLGLGMTAAKNMDYSDAGKVAAQKETLLSYVKQYMNFPALLCWSLGNEIEASHENDINLFKAIGDLAAAVKELDPHHPVTCALASSAVTRIKNLATYAPAVDFVSVNSYYPNVGSIAKNIASAGVQLPYMVTEFGPRGTWAMSPEPGRILPWPDNYSASSKALVEETSSEKEDRYLQVWQNDIKAHESDGCLGSFVFVWGYQTHGEVLNWYAAFTTDHYSYGVCDAMQKCWTGSYPSVRAPRIESRNDVTLNGKVAEAAVKVAPGSKNTARVKAVISSGTQVRYQWVLFKEGSSSPDGSMPDGSQYKALFDKSDAAEVSFTAPTETGGYRLYIFVKDDANKKAASACIPFCVE